MYKFFLFFFILVSFSTSAQRLLKMSVSINGKTERVSYITKKGIAYVSSKELANILSGNYYFNEDAAKLEFKFANYKLKVTAKNQFIVLISRVDNNSLVFQLPISTLLLKRDVYIPLKYCLNYLNLAYQRELLYDGKAKHINVTNNLVGTYSYLSKQSKSIPIVKSISNEAPNSKYDIYAISIEEKSNGTLILIKTQKQIIKPTSSIKEGTLFLFLNDVTLDPNLISKARATGLVRKIRTKNVQGNLQLEFVLKQGYTSHETFIDENNNVKIAIHNKLFSDISKDLTKEKDKWTFDVVVIDPGHGGKDPGAIGVTRIQEKEINLKIAKKLGNLIEENLPDVKVIYTRKTDKAVELYKRGKIANEQNGKLFISIHCNSLPKRRSSIRGFEVYLLRPGRTEEAIAIAEFENSVIEFEDNPDRYQELNDENFILVSMAHSAYMRYSEKFSDILNKQILLNKNLPSKGIKQAGFFVLVGASMPAVLVESGYLSNRQDEAYLKSNIGQTEIARAIFNSIQEYKEYYDKAFEDED
jgi:N-acetylmuramoyl-L-alanine amidase